MKLSVILLTTAFFLSGPVFAYEVQEVTDGGTIAGVVHQPRGSSVTTVPVDRNQDVCGAKIASNNFMKGLHGGLANAVVYLSGIPSGNAPNVKPATFSYRNCLIEPRILVAFPGSPIVLKNQDLILHTFRFLAGHAMLFDVTLPFKGQELRRRLPGWAELLFLFSQQSKAKLSPSEPVLIRVVCGKHRWESAWIFVSPHPYAAVTDIQGRFTIGDVPPGTYRIKVWYEGTQLAGKKDVGRLDFKSLVQTQKVTVKTGKASQANFSNLKPFSATN